MIVHRWMLILTNLYTQHKAYLLECYTSVGEKWEKKEKYLRNCSNSQIVPNVSCCQSNARFRYDFCYLQDIRLYIYLLYRRAETLVCANRAFLSMRVWERKRVLWSPMYTYYARYTHIWMYSVTVCVFVLHQFAEMDMEVKCREEVWEIEIGTIGFVWCIPQSLDYSPLNSYLCRKTEYALVSFFFCTFAFHTV